MQKPYFKRLFLAIFLGVWLGPLRVFSFATINEISWMGTKIESADPKRWGRYEWIELYNPTEREIDISGWRIENGSAKNEALTISSGKISSKGYFLICKTEIGGCDLINSKLSLHNEYDKNGRLTLKDAIGNIVDATPEANVPTWPGGNHKTKQTMERKNPLLAGDLPDNWQTSQEPNGTPKAQNTQSPPEPLPPGQIPLRIVTATTSDKTSEALVSTLSTTTPSQATSSDIIPFNNEAQGADYPDNLFINELLPSPEGPDIKQEWIELFNANNFEVDLSGWEIRDKIGQNTSYRCPVNTKIAPLGFLLIRREESKITLQNNGDTLELLAPNGKVVHRVDYPKSPQGKSYNRASDGWIWSKTLTPGKENVIVKLEVAQDKAQPSQPPQKKSGQNPLKTELKEMSLAKIGNNLPKPPGRVSVFLIALVIAVVSAIVVLLLKKRVSTEKHP